MNADHTAPKDIDEYIAGFPAHVQEILQQVRATIRAAAPEAEEAIRWEMPTFRLKGNLIHFAAAEHHIGIYPRPTGTPEFRQELAPYLHGKGTIRFPLDKPIPIDLLTRIVQHRVRETVGDEAAEG